MSWEVGRMNASDVWVAKDDGSDIIRAASIVAVGRDYSDAAPTRGVFVGSAAGTMNVRVRTRELAP